MKQLVDMLNDKDPAPEEGMFLEARQDDKGRWTFKIYQSCRFTAGLIGGPQSGSFWYNIECGKYWRGVYDFPENMNSLVGRLTSFNGTNRPAEPYCPHTILPTGTEKKFYSFRGSKPNHRPLHDAEGIRGIISGSSNDYRAVYFPTEAYDELAGYLQGFLSELGVSSDSVSLIASDIINKLRYNPPSPSGTEGNEPGWNYKRNL
jgi:hypothetical protein